VGARTQRQRDFWYNYRHEATDEQRHDEARRNTAAPSRAVVATRGAFTARRTRPRCRARGTGPSLRRNRTAARLRFLRARSLRHQPRLSAVRFSGRALRSRHRPRRVLMPLVRCRNWKVDQQGPDRPVRRPESVRILREQSYMFLRSRRMFVMVAGWMLCKGIERGSCRCRIFMWWQCSH